MEWLCVFLNEGHLEIDNNLTGREIWSFVMARKNFLFATSINDTKALCLHFRLIRTAKLHGLTSTGIMWRCLSRFLSASVLRVMRHCYPGISGLREYGWLPRRN
nr:transposase [Microbulbifer sp. GL-2]